MVNVAVQLANLSCDQELFIDVTAIFLSERNY